MKENAANQAIIAKIENEFASRGKQLTKRRRQVLKILIDSPVALSAYEVVERCNQSSDLTVAPMSVYRVLQFLQDEEFVHKLETSHKYVSCAHLENGFSHKKMQFLICDGCEGVVEAELSSEIMAMMQSTADEAGFVRINLQLELTGLCAQCESKSL